MSSCIRRWKKRAISIGLAATALLGVLLPVTATAAAAAPSSGTLAVTIKAPDGVPADVLIKGATELVAAKPPAGTATTVTLSVPAGIYHVEVPAINYGGVRYTGSSGTSLAYVTPGGKASLRATYTADNGARDLHVTTVGQTGFGLTWTAPGAGAPSFTSAAGPPGGISPAIPANYFLRRSAGAVAPQQVWQGTNVPVSGTSATDQGLTPGTQYSYSLFTWNDFHWSGPLTITVSTAAPAGSTNASYVAEPSTLIATAADIVSEATTGTGVQVVLSAQVAPRLLGSAVILPISSALPGGYLGVVDSASADGRTVNLLPGGLSDAFDYYDLSVDSFTTDPNLLTAAHTAAPATAAPAATTPQTAVLTAVTKPLSPAAGAAPAGESICSGSGSQTVTYSPSLALGGHFKTKLDKYNFLGASVPTGASLDMALTAKAVGAASVETTGELECGIPLPSLFKMLSVDPVPMALSLEPTAGFSVSGGVEESNIGATVTAGVQVSGTMTLKNGASFSGSTTLDASPLTPDVKANGTVGLKLGGEFILGPGVGTEDAGVIAGVKGEFDPVDASFAAYYPVGNPNFNLCTEAKAAMSAGLSLTAKAWLNNWSFSKDITLSALNGEWDYPGSPWDFPKGCNAEQPTPSSTVLGSGVSEVSDGTTGSSQQMGYEPGLVPGQKTWVLSTGLVSDIPGTPDQFASTDLGLPGDPDLTALAGYPTHDAVSYTVTLIPKGSTLHVRYLFASEEYPDFVGSQYNDVMAVYVNGKNCAYVPGTNVPVSVNTVNYKTNSQYFIDNTTSSNPYQTKMNGLTVPLTCSVPVTPGQQVTVRVAVADTSDGIYDSAVALLDGGIWTD
jgi:hypothetical protein